MMIQENNPLMCDPVTGVCELPVNNTATAANKLIIAEEKPVKIIYYTDPICSSCWGIEPQLRKLKLAYGHSFDIDYRMGGLLPDWGYNSGGISGPADVARHWDEASAYYDMPIDGDVWLEDPLHSSYPPSTAFKAAQLQDGEKAILFMRELREMLFMEKKNIAKWEHISAAADKCGLNISQLKHDVDGPAKELFNADLQLARELGVRGFPTMFFIGKDREQVKVYGSKPYSTFENALVQVFPDVVKNNYDTEANSVFAAFHSLTAKEFSVLTGTPRNEADKVLDQLTKEGKLQKSLCKNGAIWRRVKI